MTEASHTPAHRPVTPSVHFTVLGPFRLWLNGRSQPLGGPKAAAVLACLVANAGRRVSLDRLVDELWGHEAPARAEHTVRALVSRLRKLMAPAGPDVRLASIAGGYLLDCPADTIDAGRFERLVAAGMAIAESDPLAARAELGAALDLWHGQRAYEDLADLPGARDEATRLQSLRGVALERWLEVRLQLGDHAAAAADLRSAVTADPFNEHLTALFATALYRTGQQADALRAISGLRGRLVDELGLDPGPEVTRLEAAILRQDPRLVTLPSPPPQVEGAPRLEPVGGSAQLPATPTEPSVDQLDNLPEELMSFVGRGAQLAGIAEGLRRPGLVSITGPGGTGKTRLALRAARDWNQASGRGAWWVELGALVDPSQVVRHVAMSLGIREEPGSLLEELVGRRLAWGPNLLVLDNCEQVIDGAARLADRLLRGSGDVRILATSREPLSVPGEVVFRIPPLTLPDREHGFNADEVARAESVQLFVDRARSHYPGFTWNEEVAAAVAAVCTRLDGIPLAIELAAARMRTMALPDIERRLDDRFRFLVGGPRTAPARHQTLRALIDWSYGLLSDSERAVLCRLAIFSSGWDLDMAEAVMIGAGIDRPDVFDPLASLVDKSLVDAERTATGARYRLLDTVRQYASERLAVLDSDDQLALRRAHAEAFLTRAEAAVAHLSGAGQITWRRLLEPDHDNLLVGFRHFLDAPDGAVAALRFGTALSWYWTACGRYGEGFDLLLAALDRPDAGPRTPERAAALNAAGHLSFRRGDLPEAQRRLHEALDIARHLEAGELAADALRNLAWVAERRSHHDEAVALASQALDLATEAGNVHLMARAYDVRAAATQGRDPDRARRDYADALRHCEQAGDQQGRASVLNNLAVLELDQGDRDAAERHFAQALAIANEIGDGALVPYLEYGVGLAAALGGRPDVAVPPLRNAVRSAHRTGQRSLVAYALGGLAVCSTRLGRPVEAGALHAASSALFEQIGEAPERLEATLLEAALAELHVALGRGLEEALAAGRRLTVGDAVELALHGDLTGGMNVAAHG